MRLPPIKKTAISVAGLLLLFLLCLQSGLAQTCETPTNGVYEYQVIVANLRIRDMPHGDTLGYLTKAERFTTDLAEQSEVSGYLWANHARGWSALHTSSCSQVYAVRVGSVAMSGDPNKCFDEWDCHPDDHSM